MPTTVKDIWNLALAAAVPLVAVAGMVGVIWVTVRTEHPEVMVPLVLAATGALIATLRSYQNAASIQEVHEALKPPARTDPPSNDPADRTNPR